MLHRPHGTLQFAGLCFCLHAKFPLSLQIIDNIYNGSLIHVLQPIACTNHKKVRYSHLYLEVLRNSSCVPAALK
uniref:Uncharacterized protein n=1 Tax=Anguilla anguilla TaxID=7936 RepID=A0A0E9WS11_ANGAN